MNAHGVTDIQTSAQAAEALRPIAGVFTFALFGTVLLLGAVFWLALSLEPRLLGWLLGALALGLWLSVWLTRSR